MCLTTLKVGATKMGRHLAIPSLEGVTGIYRNLTAEERQKTTETGMRELPYRDLRPGKQ